LLASSALRPGVRRPLPPDPPEFVQLHAQAGLRDAVQQHLDGRQREVMELALFAGLSTREIAEHLGLKERTVREHRQHAIDKLRLVIRRSEMGEMGEA
jgi:RNA polymerase sigma factor (sigma-70 family)